MRIYLVYHFFAHYREAVIRYLCSNPDNTVYLVGDTRCPPGSGIPPAVFDSNAVFIPARCYYLWGVCMVQPRVISVVLKGRGDAFVFLGDVHFMTTWIAAAIARLKGARVLFWTHGWMHHDTRLKRRVRTAFYRIAHGLLLYGHFAKCKAIEYGFDSNNLHVIYNSLDYDKQATIRAQTPLSEIDNTRQSIFLKPELPVVITIGRLVKGRGIELLIEAADRLRAIGQPINTIVIGDGPDRDKLQSLAAARGQTTCFWGDCYDEAKLGLLIMLSDIAVAPKGVGLVAMHILAYGKPVIVPDTFETERNAPGGPEWEAIIPGFNGDHFKSGDVTSLAEKIAEWVGKSKSASLNCIQTVENRYNPKTQSRLIDLALRGYPADDTLPDRLYRA